MNDFKERVVETFLELVKIDSLSLKEENVFNYLQNRMKTLPVEVNFVPYEIQETGASSGNLIVKLPSNIKGRKSIFFDAHVDTVEPGIGIKPLVDGEVIKSDGKTILGADDKAGVAAMIVALEEIINNNFPHGDVYFIFTSAEEIGLIGVQHMDFSLIKADYGFVLDSHGSVGGVVVAAPDHVSYQIKIRGKASHAGIAPEKGINAIKIAADIVKELPQGKLNSNTVANVGLIEGGKATNIIPEECWIKGEFRSHLKEEIERLMKLIEKTINKNRKRATGIDVEFKKLYQGFSFRSQDPIIQLVKTALRAIGIEPCFEKSGGGSNTNIYNQNKIPSLTLSIGMENLHTTEEYIKIKDIVDTVRLLLKLIEIV